MAGNPTTPQASTRVLWRPEQFTRVSNPIFATNTTGWAVTAGINAAGTSITRITTDAHEGSACGSLVCTATDGSGVNFDLGADRYYDEGNHGSVYTAVVWLKRVSGSHRARVILGSEGTSADRVTLLITDLVDAWVPYTVRWLPTADRTDVQLAVTNGSAEALTVLIGKATVYQSDAFSQVENGVFDTDTAGWDIGAGVYAVAATSLTRLTTDGFAPQSQTCAELVTTATTLSGADYALGTRTFTADRAYTLRAALKRMSGGATARLRIGSIGTPAQSTTDSVTLTTDWAWYTASFTPTVALSDVAISIMNGAAEVLTVRLDHVEVYEASDDLGDDVQTLRWTRSTGSVGTIACQVLDHDGTYDPRNSAAALYGSLSPGKRIWGRATWAGALYPLFFGTLTTIEAPPLGGAHADLLAEDAFADFVRADVSIDFAQDNTYKSVRGYIVDAVVSAQTDAVYAPTASSKRLRADGIEANTHYRGTDGAVPALDLLAELNEATGTAHFVRPHVKANVGWRYYTVDRATLTDNSVDVTIDEDFTDLTGVRTTHEALENRQEVPWQAYERLPPPNADANGFGIVVIAYDPTAYTMGVGDGPYLSYTDDEYGTDDAHPDARWRYGGIGRKRWRERRRRGRKVPRRTRIYTDAFVPFTLAAGEVRRFVVGFAIPVSGPVVDFDGSATTWVSRLVEQRPQRVIVDLYATAAVTIDYVIVGGTPWLPLDDMTETIQAYQSQADHGIHPGPTLGTAYIPSRAAAEGIGHYRNWRYSEPRLRPTLHLGVGQVATMIDLDPTDHITLSADRWRIDALPFLVTGGTWEVRQKGMDWTCQLDLEELPTHTDWLTLDHATLGLDEAVVLAY